MKKCNIVLNELSNETIRELFSDYNRDKTRIIFDLDGNFKIECKMYQNMKDVFYGRKRKKKNNRERYQTIIDLGQESD